MTNGIERSTLSSLAALAAHAPNAAEVLRWVGLQRRRTRQDARMYAVRLTAKGRDALAATRPAAARADERVLAGLNARQRQDLLSLLTDVVRSMDEMSEAA